MMKILVAFLFTLSLASGFAPAPKGRTTAMEVRMGFLDNLFKPVHGAGTGAGHYDELMKEEQALQRDRKIHHLDKKDLKKKYGKKKEGFLEGFMSSFHGHGTAENELDEMYEEQQQMLYNRREYFGNKDMLRKKYHNPGQDHLSEIATIKDDPALLNKKEDDAMFVDDSAGFKFPWDKKLKP